MSEQRAFVLLRGRVVELRNDGHNIDFRPVGILEWSRFAAYGSDVPTIADDLAHWVMSAAQLPIATGGDPYKQRIAESLREQFRAIQPARSAPGDRTRPQAIAPRVAAIVARWIKRVLSPGADRAG